jgi:hypothetical protein
MGRAAYSGSLALMACVLVGTVHAQDGIVFKEDVRQIESFYKRLFAIAENLEKNADYSHREITKDEACRMELFVSVRVSMSYAETVISISSEMQSKIDQEIVSNRLKPMISQALLWLRRCARNPMGAGEACPSNHYIKTKASEIAKLCMEGTTLLNNFLGRVDHIK